MSQRSGSERSGADREQAIRTFLIADIRGYTAFTREKGDEAAARLATHAGVIHTDLEDLIRIAQQRLTRGLTPDECRSYLHVEECPSSTGLS